jgi:hypothetical protein
MGVITGRQWRLRAHLVDALHRRYRIVIIYTPFFAHYASFQCFILKFEHLSYSKNVYKILYFLL